MLISFGGLPGVGKSTIARAVAHRLGATYLRIDTIEQALRSANVLAGEVEGAGYLVARDLAATNLANGLPVVIDSVNPIRLTRNMFRAAGQLERVPIFEVHVVCSNADEHKRRVETRKIDIAALRAPTWDEVQARQFEPWPEADLLLDTAVLQPDAAIEVVCTAARIRGQLP